MSPDPSCLQRVLVVTDNEAIGRHAVRWAEAFAQTGTVHRVRLVTAADPGAVEAVAAEASSLGATVVLAAGGDATRAVAARAAGRLGLPLVTDEAAGSRDR
jgi:glycerol dehydrogenase-like iron-containing ADH family enzyme